MPPSKTCIIKRPVWGFTVQEEVQLPAGLTGPKRAVNITAQNVYTECHELIPYGHPDEYMLMCMHCAEIWPQSNWIAVLNQVDSPPTNNISPFPNKN